MRTFDRTCDRICCKIRILHIFPRIIAFSTLQKLKLCRICENSHIFTHLRICMRSHFSACYRLLSVQSMTTHTVRHRLLIKRLMSYIHLFGLTVSLNTVQTVRGVARISVWWGHRSSAKGAKSNHQGVWGRGSGCPPPHWGWGLGMAVLPPQNFFWIFISK